MHADKEFIAEDHAGRRYTHVPSGATCLRHLWMNDGAWADKLSKFLADHADLDIHHCPDRYVASDVNFVTRAASLIEDMKALAVQHETPLRPAQFGL